LSTAVTVNVLDPVEPVSTALPFAAVPAQVAMPEPASLQANPAITVWFWTKLAPLAGDAIDAAGGVASRLIVIDLDVVPPLLLAVQVSVVPAVSAVIHVLPHPDFDEIRDCASVTVHVTMTFDLYQPPLPGVPMTVAVMPGGVESFAHAGVATAAPSPRPRTAALIIFFTGTSLIVTFAAGRHAGPGGTD
jgi:hypothetical protein